MNLREQICGFKNVGIRVDRASVISVLHSTNSHNLLFCDVDVSRINLMLIGSVSETSLLNTRKDKHFANFAAVFSLA